MNSTARVHKISTETTGEKCFSYEKEPVLVHFTRTCIIFTRFWPQIHSSMTTLPSNMHCSLLFSLFFWKLTLFTRPAQYVVARWPQYNLRQRFISSSCTWHVLIANEIIGKEGIEQLFTAAQCRDKKLFIPCDDSFNAMPFIRTTHPNWTARGSVKCQKYQWFIRNESSGCSLNWCSVYLWQPMSLDACANTQNYQPATIVRWMCTNHLHKMRVKDAFFCAQMLHKANPTRDNYNNKWLSVWIAHSRHWTARLLRFLGRTWNLHSAQTCRMATNK